MFAVLCLNFFEIMFLSACFSGVLARGKREMARGQGGSESVEDVAVYKSGERDS